MGELMDTVERIAKRERSIAVREFTMAILHGDDAHKIWLMEASNAFINGEPLPQMQGTEVSHA